MAHPITVTAWNGDGTWTARALGLGRTPWACDLPLALCPRCRWPQNKARGQPHTELRSTKPHWWTRVYAQTLDLTPGPAGGWGAAPVLLPLVSGNPRHIIKSLNRRSPPAWLCKAPAMCLHMSFHTCARSTTAGLTHGHIFTQRPGRLPRYTGVRRHTQAHDPRPTGRRRHLVPPGLESILPQGRSKPTPGTVSERGMRPDPVQGFPGPNGLRRKLLLKSWSTAIICCQSSPSTPGTAHLPAPEPARTSGQVDCLALELQLPVTRRSKGNLLG
ncbi:uncharacterized protein [Ovis canadensis]|uniref:uncharacterized protein n=1 Tax=Ovis canadensis TaxID=37174 RepID=UPI003750E768